MLLTKEKARGECPGPVELRRSNFDVLRLLLPATQPAGAGSQTEAEQGERRRLGGRDLLLFAIRSATTVQREV